MFGGALWLPRVVISFSLFVCVLFLFYFILLKKANDKKQNNDNYIMIIGTLNKNLNKIKKN